MKLIFNNLVTGFCLPEWEKCQNYVKFVVINKFFKL